LRMAEIKNIPARVFASGFKVWQFGHGTASVQFLEATTSKDGLPGIALSRNKAVSSQFIKTLGFPTTRWGLVNNLESGIKLARKIGYPVVVKPVDGGKGRGVTANITQEKEFVEAFRKASSVPMATVLVENFVVGNDYRIGVFGGRIGWAIRRMPAEVIGNGKLSVQELIDEENSRREQLRNIQFSLKSINEGHRNRRPAGRPLRSIHIFKSCRTA